MNILILEPFLGGSGKAFLNGLMQYSRHQLFPVTLTEHYWKWRQHGISIDLAEKALQIDAPIELMIASNFTNLPAFVSLTRKKYAGLPIIFYMHENQLTKPLPKGQQRDLTFSYVNFLSTLIADRVLFSSQFHFDQYFEHLPEFLEQFGEYAHKELIQHVKLKSQVLYPGLFLQQHDQLKVRKKTKERLVIVWNQRWEYDRNPAMFFRMMNRLDDAGCDFDLILAGDSDFDKPVEYERALQRYGNRVIHSGYVSDPQVYSWWLHQGDVVVSTSDYEFFSVAIMEAIYCGCHPVLPKKLTYPELIPEHLHEPLLHAPVFYKDEDEMFAVLKRILDRQVSLLPFESLKQINRHRDWKNWIQYFDAIFEEMTA